MPPLPSRTPYLELSNFQAFTLSNFKLSNLKRLRSSELSSFQTFAARVSAIFRRTPARVPRRRRRRRRRQTHPHVDETSWPFKLASLRAIKILSEPESFPKFEPSSLAKWGALAAMGSSDFEGPSESVRASEFESLIL